MKMQQMPLSRRRQAIYIGVALPTRLEIKMNTRHAIAFRFSSIIGGVSLALGTVTPAFAAMPVLPVSLAPSDFVLGGLLVVLVTALVMRLAHRQEDGMSNVPAATGRDMRWWKQPQM